MLNICTACTETLFTPPPLIYIIYCTGPVVVLLLLVGYASAEIAPSLGDVITSRDQTRLRELFRKTPIDSLTMAYYVSNGLRILGEQDNVWIRYLVYMYLFVCTMYIIQSLSIHLFIYSFICLCQLSIYFLYLYL